jgi:hypothetical protein
MCYDTCKDGKTSVTEMETLRKLLAPTQITHPHIKIM